MQTFPGKKRCLAWWAAMALAGTLAGCGRTQPPEVPLPNRNDSTPAPETRPATPPSPAASPVK